MSEKIPDKIKSIKLRRIRIPIVILTLLFSAIIYFQFSKHQISQNEYFDKVHGAWLGKMIGVYYGQFTEFGIVWSKPEEPVKISWRGKDYSNNIPPGWIMPLEYANDQDDIGINLLNLRILEKYGLNPTGKQIGNEWVRNDPAVAGANMQAKINMRNSLWPPISGHPAFNKKYMDIDAQIDNDIFGMICPGMTNTCSDYALKFAKVSSSEEGVYPAVFITQCISSAFFEKDIEKIIRKSLKRIPSDSMSAKIVKDVLKWHKENPDWKTTRSLIVQKYPLPDIYAVPNLGFVVTALLYGGGDFEKTMQIGAFCGYDSDCNPASACGILGAMNGASSIPDVFKDALKNTFHNLTIKDYADKMSIKEIAERTSKIGEKIILANDGQRIEKNGGIFYIIPRQNPGPPVSDPVQTASDDLREARIRVRDEAVDALYKKKDIELIKESLMRLNALSEIQPEIIDSFTKTVIFTAAQDYSIYTTIAADILAKTKDPRAIKLFMIPLRNKNLPLDEWIGIHQSLGNFYYTPTVANFFLRELTLYETLDSTKTLALIPFFRYTPEITTFVAIKKMEQMECMKKPEFQNKLMDLHYHPSLKIRDEVEAMLPKTTMTWRGWDVRCSGNQPLVGLIDEYNGKKDVLCTHPYDIGFPAYLCKWIEIEEGKDYTLKFSAAPFNQEVKVDEVGGYTRYETADWHLYVFIDGRWTDNKIISWKNKKASWQSFEYNLLQDIDLKGREPFAPRVFARDKNNPAEPRKPGTYIGVILQNNAKDWYWEQAFWADLEVVVTDKAKESAAPDAKSDK